jgi:subtilisin family serine protease
MRPLASPTLPPLVVALVMGALAPPAVRAAGLGAAVALGDGATMTGFEELSQAKAALDPVDEKLDSRLRPWHGRRGRTGLRPGPRLPPAWRRGGLVRVLVRLDAFDDDDRTALADAGLAIERDSPRRRLVEGWIARDKVRTLAALDGVRSVRPADRGQTRAGRITSAGDVAARADLARALGVSGSGVRVGVVSDGIDGAAAARASGDLAAGSPDVPARCSAGSGSEGTAMLEIVHDLAPGATLLFASGIDSPLAFMQAVECLTDAGAQVIVDDLGFFGEPYFEDGDLADAVREAVRAGVSYHSAAGNAALLHYEAPFVASPQSRFHNFSTTGGVDNTNSVSIPRGGSLLCVLQWDDPFGAANDDYDLLLVDQDRSVIAAGDNVQNGDDDPIEIVAANNVGGAAEVAGLVIERTRGAARTLDLFCVRDVDGMEYSTPGASIFGHAALSEAVTVAAIDVADPGLDSVEPFSSQGPARLTFPPEERPKPDVAAFDGVATTVAGFAPFFGTSAAAPHVAAIAALMLERNPGLTPQAIQAALRETAVDVGMPGFDAVAGAGRVDAVAAVSAVCVSDAECDDGDVCTIDRCEGGRCSGVSCDDGNPCNGIETCAPDGSGCVPGVAEPDGTPCPDATVCNGEETCMAGVCTPGAALSCADGDSCTEDVCDPQAGCRFPPVSGVASICCVLDRGLPECGGARLPRAVRRPFARARRLVDCGGPEIATPRKQRVRVRRAARALKRASRAAVRARRHLTLECQESLAAALGDARARARALAQVLR